MTKIEYWLLGFKKGWYKDSHWVKSCLSLFETNSEEDYLLRKNDKGFYFIKPNDELEYITDVTDTSKPLFRVPEMFVIPKGMFYNEEDIKTSIGCSLQNMLMTIGPFKGKIPYINKNFKPNDIESYLLHKWTRSKDDVKDDEKEGEIFTEEFLEFCNNSLYLIEFTQTLVASVTEKALCSNPLLDKRRKELYAEYKDQLNDPVIVARIDKELAKVDKDYLKGDESMGFLISGSQFTNVRKRLSTHFGMAKGLEEGDEVFVGRSLKEGIDLTRLSDYVNDAYSGSIGRGLETQNGGVETKNAIRAAANLKVTIDDCGSNKGQLIKFNDRLEKNQKYLGYSFIQNGKTILITDDNIGTLSGKEVLMRSPAYCVSTKSSFCKTCVGPNVADYPNGVVSVNSSLGSAIMSIAMASMHSAVTSTTPWSSDLIS